MSKFNTATARSRGGAAVIETTGTTTNHKGAIAETRSPKSELYLLAISDFVEDTFYESTEARQERITRLVREIDPQWLQDFVHWLRHDGNMRSVALSVALRAAKAMNEQNIAGARSIVSAALLRADEPGEALAFWHSEFGRRIPSAVKRGIADAASASYSQYSYLKYDSSRHAYRFADVLQLTHPTPKSPEQSDLFKFILEDRYNASAKAPASLSMIRARQTALPGTDPQALKAAGYTWEDVAGQGPMTAEKWEAIIPNMGYMALLRNLRNFEQAGVDSAPVIERLIDPEQVERSRQFPFRFYSAFKALEKEGHYTYMPAIQTALDLSLKNVPAPSGNTLILLDNSGSMYCDQGYKGMTLAETGNLFGVALARRAEKSTVVSYGSTEERIPVGKTGSVLRKVRDFHAMGGTDTRGTLERQYNSSYDRVVLITDEQYGGYYGDPYSVVGKDVPVFTFNLAGYRAGTKEAPNRYTLGGLTDQAFRTIPLVELGKDEHWPWEV